jgi:hypothetical protein
VHYPSPTPYHQDEARGRDEELRRVRTAADQLRVLVASGALTA